MQPPPTFLLDRIDKAIGKLELRLSQIPIDEQVDTNPEPGKLRGMIKYFQTTKQVVKNLEVALTTLGV